MIQMSILKFDILLSITRSPNSDYISIASGKAKTILQISKGNKKKRNREAGGKTTLRTGHCLIFANI